MKTIQDKNLNDITYLKDEKDLTRIIDKFYNELGFDETHIIALIILGNKYIKYQSKNLSFDEKIDSLVKFMENMYNYLIKSKSLSYK